MLISIHMLAIGWVVWNTYRKPYDTTTMLLILAGVTVLLIAFQWFMRKRK